MFLAGESYSLAGEKAGRLEPSLAHSLRQKSSMNSIVVPREMKLLGQPKIPTLLIRGLLSQMKVFRNSNPALVRADMTKV